MRFFATWKVILAVIIVSSGLTIKFFHLLSENEIVSGLLLTAIEHVAAAWTLTFFFGIALGMFCNIYPFIHSQNRSNCRCILHLGDDILSQGFGLYNVCGAASLCVHWCSIWIS